MNTMTQVKTKTPAAPSFAPVQYSLSGQHLSIAPVHIAESRLNPLASQPPLLQAKLTIGAVDDPYEHEADRVAETVMRMPEPALQRK